MSAKNRLQEIYQKKQMELPIYNSVNFSNLPHRPEWKSHVKTVDGHSIWSGSFPKKTHAENDAAKKCIILVKGSEPPKREKYVPPKKPQAILLIDLENIPQVIKQPLNHPKGLWVIGFVNRFNRGIMKDREWIETNMELVVTQCTGNDVADHALTFYAGMLSERYRGQSINWAILSADAFSVVPTEFLRRNGHAHVLSMTTMAELRHHFPGLI